MHRVRDRVNTYRSLGGSEPVDAPLGAGFLVRPGDVGLQGVPDEIPELVVLGAEEDDEAGGLRVEGGWDVLGCEADELEDARVGDGRGLVELVDCAAVDDGVGDGELFGHFGGDSVGADGDRFEESWFECVMRMEDGLGEEGEDGSRGRSWHLCGGALEGQVQEQCSGQWRVVDLDKRLLMQVDAS